ncbi:MAG: AAA family ATPase [Edaphocola sp.]
MQQTDTDNLVFEQAVAFVTQTDQHLFLTGKAGTGKTTFLRYIRQHCHKRMAVLAPTGVAAINAGGVTIHSFFQLPFGTYLPTMRTVWGGEHQNLYNRNQLLAKLRFNKAKLDLIRGLDLLVIDEISMVRADVIEAVDTVLRHVRRNEEPFGGLQLLFIGDMFQLPPVVRDNEMELMQEYYPGQFFFDAPAVQAAQPVHLELKKIYRQRDDEFIAILNNVRNNRCTEDDLARLEQNYQPYFTPSHQEGYITLTSHNHKADTINQQALDRLPATLHKLEARVSSEFPEHAYPVDKILYLKEGAQIMFIKNDKGEARRFYNGRIGMVERIDPQDKKILISFPGEKDLLPLEPETWRNIRYRYDQESDEVKEEELGTFSQFPIRLAWAVTIHKSQGLTFEKAIVDAGQSFAPGQVYVALSRLTNLDGLVLRSKITPASIVTDERILAFAAREEPQEKINTLLADAQMIFAERSLVKTFDWRKLTDEWQLMVNSYGGRALPDVYEIVPWAQNMLVHLQQQEQTALKFRNWLQEQLHKGKGTYGPIHERTMAAVGWFGTELQQQAIDKLKAHIKEQQAKQRTKKYVQELKEILTTFERKYHQVQQAVTITDALANDLSREQLMQRVDNLHAPIVVQQTSEASATKAPVGESKRISLRMFNEGMAIDEIAAARNFAASTIEGHLADFVYTGEIDPLRLMTIDKLEKILAALKQTPDALSGALKASLGEGFSFADIKAGMQYFKKQQEEKT